MLRSAALLLALVGPAFGQDVAETPAIDAAFFQSVLENPTNALETRRVALTRLLADPGPAGRLAVLDLFEQADDAVRSGLVSTLANAAVESPDLADALAAAAVTSVAGGSERRGLWSGLLDLAGPGLDAALVELAGPSTASVERRVAAIDLLGGFATPLAAETLMDLAEGDANETVRTASFDSLRRLSGMPFGDAPEAWRSWWAAGGAELLEATCEQRAERLAARLDRAERDRKAADRQTERAAEQLRQVYGELLLGMELAPRQERILRLLESEFEPVRRLAIEQVERMLRNGDRIDERGIPVALEKLLDDPAPGLRIRGAALLGTLAPDRVGALVSSRLSEEREPAVVNAYLDVLAGAAGVEIADAVVARLRDPATAEAAARAAIRMLDVDASAAEWREAAAAAVRRRLDDSATPAIVELLAVAGDDSDDPRLRELLGGEDPRLRRAVAEGWGRRGRIEPLRERASDPVVYPALAAAIVDRVGGIEGLDLLLDLPRPAESQADFERVLSTLLERLSVEDASSADRRLAEVDSIPTELRLRGLRRALEASPSEESEASVPSVRLGILERLAILLLEADRAEEAVGVLRAETAADRERLRPLLFKALVLSAEFDAAASREPEVGTWLALLAGIDVAAVSRREVLATEIARRFAVQLDDEGWARLRAVVPTLGVPPEAREGAEARPDSDPDPPSGDG